jgi:ABC-2 type transport system permease protein
MRWLARINAITLKEFRQLSRDRLTFGMVVMIPLIQLLLFGYAINNNIRNIGVGVVDDADSYASRSIIEAVRATQVVNLLEQYSSAQEAEQAITKGTVRAVLYLPHNLEQRMAQGNQPLGQWIVDGSDNIVASALLGLRNMPLAELQRGTRAAVPVFETLLLFNPERRTPVNIVPGLLAVILTMTMILFTATAIVREKERGNQRRAAADSGRYAAVHRGQPDTGADHFHGSKDTIAGHADDGVHPVAVHPAVGLPVPL